MDKVNQYREELLTKTAEELTNEDVEFMVNDMSDLDMPDDVQAADHDGDSMVGEPKHWRKEALHQIHRKKRITKARKANKLAGKQRKVNRK